MSDETTPPIKSIWLIATVVTFVFFVMIAAYASVKTDNYTDFNEQRAIDRKATLAKLQQEEQLLLAPVDAKGNPTAEWVDQGKKIVRIPIEEAMAREIDTLKEQPPETGCEIPVAAPAAPASTNAAPASASPATNASPAAPAPPKK